MRTLLVDVEQRNVRVAQRPEPRTPRGTEVLLRYGQANGWLDGKPAVISRKVGKGRITYVGALVDDAVMKGLIDGALNDAGVARDFAVPEDVELMTREGEGRGGADEAPPDDADIEVSRRSIHRAHLPAPLRFVRRKAPRRAGSA